ncbi:MAG: phosphate acyltransferase PlsX [Bacillota bacterium]|nr:phosphate acyltransferase PlsX [Bacillota bacterium]
MLTLFLDAMGGDNAPQATCAGAVMALRADADLRLILGGIPEVIKQHLTDADDVMDRIQILNAPEIITNNESAAMAIRQKKESAVVKGMLMVREGEADGFISAGSTGATLVGGMLRLGRVPGIERPALAPVMPGENSEYLLIDCGANVDCRPEYLAQFGLMGDAYMRKMRRMKSPRIGLVNNGAEEEKGSQLYIESHKLLKKEPINFVGNIEARYIPAGQADVIVCDGFDGNIILKYTEGIASALMGIIKRELMADTRSKLGALLSKPAFKRVKKMMDYTEVGGAPLLGVRGAVVKAHGSSNAKAIASAIRQATLMARNQVPQAIEENLNKH